jgi:hypothetical protein
VIDVPGRVSDHERSSKVRYSVDEEVSAYHRPPMTEKSKALDGHVIRVN